jgi:hypothetical protein
MPLKSQFNNLNSFGRITRSYENAVNFVIKNIENLFQKHNYGWHKAIRGPKTGLHAPHTGAPFKYVFR